MDFNMIWRDYIFVLLKDLYPWIVGGVGCIGALWGARYFLSHPDSKYAKYYPLVIQAVLYADKTMGDGNSKAKIALDEFARLYTAHSGETPSAAALDWASRMKELVLLEVKKIAVAKKGATPATPATPAK